MLLREAQHGDCECRTRTLLFGILGTARSCDRKQFFVIPVKADALFNSQRLVNPF